MQSIENGNSLIIRGEKTDNAVLCSDCETFEIKEVECSNTTFLAQNLRIPSKKELHARTDSPNLSVATISSVFQSYLEIRSTPPRLGRLRELLSSCPFKGNEFELECLHAQTHKYTLENVLDKCQASRQELLKALNSMRAVPIENFWRILDFQYTIRCVNQILQLIEDNSWDWRKFPFEDTLDTLCVLEPRSILEIMLTDWFAERIANGAGTDL